MAGRKKADRTPPAQLDAAHPENLPDGVDRVELFEVPSDRIHTDGSITVKPVGGEDAPPPPVDFSASDPPVDSPPAPTVLDRVRDRMRAELLARIERGETSIQAQAESYANGETTLVGFLADVTKREKELAEDRRELAALRCPYPFDDNEPVARIAPVIELLGSLAAKHSPATPPDNSDR